MISYKNFFVAFVAFVTFVAFVAFVPEREPSAVTEDALGS